MMMVEDIKKDFNNSLKEIQENTAKELQVLKEKQGNTSKEVMEMKKKKHIRCKEGSRHNKETIKTIIYYRVKILICDSCRIYITLLLQ
jgi:endonuclease IV